MRKPTRFHLGQQVIITGQVIKDQVPEHGPLRERDAPFYHWSRVHPITTYVQHPAPAEHGVIVGKRTVMDYRLFGGTYDEPTEAQVIRGSARTAWMVAWDLHRKPILCLDGQVTPWQT